MGSDHPARTAFMRMFFPGVSWGSAANAGAVSDAVGGEGNGSSRRTTAEPASGQGASMQPYLSFDELLVVSDLHLGGFGDRKIFALGTELASLIDYAAHQARTPGRRVAFVINGDFVDFIAARDARCFDPEGACGKLDEIVQDAAFASVFDALRRFVAAPGARLVVNLGNHDLELALPWVREHLLDSLAAGDAAARGRILLETGGTGVPLQVGNATVLCVHGNEVDDWNVVDHEALRRITRDLQHGRPVEPWVPNAGTQVVVEVMNEIKRGRYPFVDLLKPETGGVLRALVALEPRLAGKAFTATPAATRRAWDGLRRWAGFLGGDEPAPPRDVPVPDPAARQRRRSRVAAERERGRRDLLEATEERLRAGVAPMDLVGTGAQDERLDLGRALALRAAGRDTADVLREALQPLVADRSFDVFEPDDTFVDLDGRASGAIDLLIAGHTHLERCLPRRAGRGLYYNSGTWARLIRIDEAALADATAFARYFTAFSAGSMQALDAAGVVTSRPTFVHVWTESGRARADLRHVHVQNGNCTFAPATGDDRAAWVKS